MCMAGLAELGDVIEAGAVLVDDVSDELCGVFREPTGAPTIGTSPLGFSGIFLPSILVTEFSSRTSFHA